MPDVDFAGAVHECNVMVGARLAVGGESVEGGYSVGLYLDSDAGVAHGREVHGQPKKLASLALETRGDLIVGEVERNGITILTATTPFKQQRAEPADMRRHFDFAENINYKVIPHIDGTPAIRQLTARRLQEIDVSECWVGPCTVELRPNAQAPIFRLPVIEPLEGLFLARELHARRRARALRLPGPARVTDDRLQGGGRDRRADRRRSREGAPARTARSRCAWRRSRRPSRLRARRPTRMPWS